MDFLVQFTGVTSFKNKDYASLFDDDFTCGYEDVIKIRSDLKLNIGLDKINIQTYHPLSYSSIEVQEKYIQQIPYFKNKCDVNVFVIGGLTEFFERIYNITYEKLSILNKLMLTRPKIKYVNVEFKIDKDTVMRNWIYDGCPLEWDRTAKAKLHKD